MINLFKTTELPDQVPYREIRYSLSVREAVTFQIGAPFHRQSLAKFCQETRLTHASFPNDPYPLPLTLLNPDEQAFQGSKLSFPTDKTPRNITGYFHFRKRR
jgi:hypothetical protein